MVVLFGTEPWHKAEELVTGWHLGLFCIAMEKHCFLTQLIVGTIGYEEP